MGERFWRNLRSAKSVLGTLWKKASVPFFFAAAPVLLVWFLFPNYRSEMGLDMRLLFSSALFCVFYAGVALVWGIEASKVKRLSIIFCFMVPTVAVVLLFGGTPKDRPFVEMKPIEVQKGEGFARYGIGANGDIHVEMRLHIENLSPFEVIISFVPFPDISRGRIVYVPDYFSLAPDQSDEVRVSAIILRDALDKSGVASDGRLDRFHDGRLFLEINVVAYVLRRDDTNCRAWRLYSHYKTRGVRIPDHLTRSISGPEIPDECPFRYDDADGFEGITQ